MSVSKEPNVMLAPNTAVEYDDARIKFPAFASVKFDGMRIKIMPCSALSCRAANIYSRQHRMQCAALHHYFDDLLKVVQKQQVVLDGELWSPILTFSEIMSALVKPIPQHKLQFQVFDMMTVDEWYKGTEQPFMYRYAEYPSWIKRFCGKMFTGHLDATRSVESVEQFVVKTPEDVEKFFNASIKSGHEGCMIREVRSKYKHGRGTLNEGTIFKFKKWVTEDAKIVGFKQATKMKSELIRERDELGALKPINKQDQRISIEAIGSVEVELKDGTRCYVSNGKGDPLFRERVSWQHRDKAMGRWVEITFQQHGTKNKPRMGRLVRFRPDLDEPAKKKSSGDLTDAFTPPKRGHNHKIARLT